MRLKKQFKLILPVILIAAMLFSTVFPIRFMPVKATEYAPPSNMLYIKSSTNGPLKQRIEVVPGATYHFSFGLSNQSPDFTVIGQNKDRVAISINPQEISKIESGDYTLYRYSLTIPDNIPVQSGKYRVFIGLAFGTDAEIYAFDFSLIKSDDTSNTNILSNGAFSTNLNDWAWGDSPWFTTGQTGGKGKTEWEDSNVTIKIMPFDASKFSNDKMLYFKSSNAGPFMVRLNFNSGAEYTISFGMSNNLTTFDIVGKTDGERNNISIEETLVSKEDKGNYTLYEYTFLFPSTQPDGLAFIGFSFPANSEGYLFDVTLVQKDDTTGKNLISNGDFSSGLDRWAWGWDAWFESWGVGKGKTEWSNASVKLAVETFDESKFTIEVPEPPKDQMLYFKSKNTGPLMIRLNFTAGAEYVITFGMSNNLTTFDIVGKTDDDRKSISINETLVSKEDKGKYTLYQYRFTFPDTQPTGLAFIGFTFPSNCEGYVFNVKLVKEDDETAKQLISNGDFSAGLNHWAWDWDAWFEAWGTGKDLKEYSAGNLQLNTMDFDESKFTIPVPEPPKDQMLYFKSKSAGPLMTRLNFTAGATYTVSFGLSNNVTTFDIIAKTDGDRKNIGFGETLVSKEDKGRYTLYQYRFTFPATQPTGLAFIGFTFQSSCEGYLFNVKLVKEDDETAKQLISNGDFSAGLDHWAWDWDAWFETWDAGKGLKEYSTGNLQLNTMDFDESKFTIPVPEPPKDQMLYYKNNNSGPLMTRVSLIPGQKYYFSYYVSKNAVGTSVVALTDDDRKTISINAKKLTEENAGRHTFYKYEFTVPSTFKTEAGKTTGLAFVGVKFLLGYDGYFYKAKLWKADDDTQKQMLSNGDFSSGLDSWAWDWDAWFVNYPGLTGIGLNQWENKNVKLAVMDFDESKFSTKIPDVPVSDRRMLQFKNGANPTPFAARISVTPGKTFILTYSVFCTDETSLSVLTDDDRYTIHVNEELVKKTEHKYYTTYTYRFTIPKTVKDNLIFVGINIPYYAEGYLFDLSCYEAKDTAKKQVWSNAQFKSYLDTWIWGWHAWFGMGTDENSYLKPKGMIHWTNGIDEVKIMDFDIEKIKALIKDINRDDGVWWSKSDYSEDEFANEDEKLGKGSVSGTFLMTDKKPLVHVKMLLKSMDRSYYAYTDEFGQFVFSDVLEGDYELYVIGADDEEISTGFFGTVEEGDALFISLTSDISGLKTESEEIVEYFDGVVYTPQLKVVPGLKVYLRGFGEVKTDQNGHFEFKDVPAGEYELYTVLSNGKEYVFRKVSLQKDLKLSVKLKYDPAVGVKSEKQAASLAKTIALIAALVGGVLLIGAGTVFFILKKAKKKKTVV